MLPVFGSKLDLESVLNRLTLSFRFNGDLKLVFRTGSDSELGSPGEGFGGTFGLGLLKLFTLAWTFLYFLVGDSGFFTGLCSRLVFLEGALEAFLDWVLDLGVVDFAGGGRPGYWRVGETFLLEGVLLLLGMREGEDCDWLGSGELPGIR